MCEVCEACYVSQAEWIQSQRLETFFSELRKCKKRIFVLYILYEIIRFHS